MRSPSNKPGLLTLTIKDKSALYLAYMPFVKNGGLFIPTNSNYRLGDEVFMLLNLMGEEEKLPVAGRVIWMTPKGAQGKRTAGIGVQFSDQDRGNTQKKIENYLAGALGGDAPKASCGPNRSPPTRRRPRTGLQLRFSVIHVIHTTCRLRCDIRWRPVRSLDTARRARPSHRGCPCAPVEKARHHLISRETP